MPEPLYALGLGEAAAQIAGGHITSEILTQSYLEVIARRDPSVRAWKWFDSNRALRMARAADRNRAESMQKGSEDPRTALPLSERGDLLGVPIGIKDIIDVAGLPTTMGSPIYEHHVPRRSAALVTELLKSGAFAMGKCVTTEFAFMVPNVTRNPWNIAHTPGGSSSGSAAAVASGMVPGAIGTQTNGSVIRPAAYCGVVGYKPAHGRISTEGVLPFSASFDTPGVFARSVSDAALLASWLTRSEGVISHSIAVAKTPPRLLAVRTHVWDKAEPSQRRQFESDIARLRGAGAVIEEKELPDDFRDSHRVHRLIMLYEAARAARGIRRHFRSQLSEFLNRALDEGEATAESAYAEALAKCEGLRRGFEAFFSAEFDGVITPPASGEAPRGLETTGDPAFCTMWTLLAVPAVSIPTGIGPQGLPLGLQIIGRAGESNAALGLAAWCERHSPFQHLVDRELKPSRGES